MFPGPYFNFSGLTTAGGVSTHGSNNDDYYINVCGAVSSIAKCSNASVCFNFVYFPNDFYLIALNSNTPAAAPPTLANIIPGDSSQGVTLTFQNGALDSASVTTVIRLICKVSKESERR